MSGSMRSGISNVVAVTALAVVAILLVVLAATTGAGNVGKVAAGNPSISVSAEATRISQNSYAISMDIANIGDCDVTITGVEVKGTACLVNLVKTLKPSQTHHLSFTCSLSPGRYVLVVRGGELSWEFPLNVT